MGPVLPFLGVSAFLSFRIRNETALLRKGAVDAGGGSRSFLLAEIGRRPLLALGFRNFLADIVWLEAVQTASPIDMTPGEYDRLVDQISTVNNLDPRFVVPYLVGGLVIGESPSHSASALRILENGKKAHPDEWMIPFFIGYIYYFVLSDPGRGGEALMEASRITGVPPFIPMLATRMLSEGGSPTTALAFLDRMLSQETNPGRREILIRRMKDVIAERDLQDLEKAVGEYRARKGIPPVALGDLVSAGILRGLPREPHGGDYLLSGSGEVRSSRMPHRLKVFRPR